MTPIPTRPPKSVDAAASALHRLARRDEGGRVAGMLVGCLIGGIAAAALVYLCFNCAFAPHPRRKTVVQPPRPPVHKAHPRSHRAPSPSPVPPATVQPHSHTRARRHQHPHVHRWTHRHHRHARHHRHGCGAKPGREERCPKAKRKTKPRPARRDRRRPPQALGGQNVRFMPMPPMTAMPVAPAAAAAAAVGMGTGVGGGANMPPPLEDGFVDYGPALDQDFGPGMGWDGADPDFRLEDFAAAVARDAPEDGGATCNECCYSFFDALCGVPRGARDLRREAAGDGRVVLEDNEMAAV